MKGEYVKWKIHQYKFPANGLKGVFYKSLNRDRQLEEEGLSIRH